MTPTTRTYHRNSDLAFPRTARYGCAIEKPADHSDAIVLIGCVGAVLICLMLIVAGVLA